MTDIIMCRFAYSWSMVTTQHTSKKLYNSNRAQGISRTKMIDTDRS